MANKVVPAHSLRSTVHPWVIHCVCRMLQNGHNRQDRAWHTTPMKTISNFIAIFTYELIIGCMGITALSAGCKAGKKIFCPKTSRESSHSRDITFELASMSGSANVTLE